jgi:hypothetical protein
LTRLRTLVAVSVIALLAAGCQAQVSTTIEITSPTASAITAQATFSGEIATYLEANPADSLAVAKLFSAYAHTQPSITQGSSTLTFSAPLSYAQLTAASGVLGVASAQLTPASGSDITLHAALVPPTKLLAAITKGVASQPDATALSATMVRLTTVALVVDFPGGVSSASPGVAISGNSASYTTTLANASSRTITITGNPHANNTGRIIVYLLIGAAILIAAYFLVIAPARTRRP